MQRIGYCLGIVLSLAPFRIGLCQQEATPCYQTQHPHCLNFVTNEEKVCSDKSCQGGYSNGQWVVICSENSASKTKNNTVSSAVPVVNVWALDDQTPMNPWQVSCTTVETCGCDPRLPLPQACSAVQVTDVMDTSTNSATGDPCRNVQETQ
jgi:hypothetical protein